MIRLLVVFFLTGCYSMPGPHMYNIDKEQDLMCYAKFGGQWGYCDKDGQ